MTYSRIRSSFSFFQVLPSYLATPVIRYLRPLINCEAQLIIIPLSPESPIRSSHEFSPITIPLRMSVTCPLQIPVSLYILFNCKFFLIPEFLFSHQVCLEICCFLHQQLLYKAYKVYLHHEVICETYCVHLHNQPSQEASPIQSLRSPLWTLLPVSQFFSKRL